MKRQFAIKNNILLILIILFILTTATLGLFFLTKDNASAASPPDDLERQPIEADDSNGKVTFDAYFADNDNSETKKHSISANVYPEYPTFYLEMLMPEQGTLLNPQVQFFDKNGTSDINFDLGFGTMTSNYINSSNESTKTINFKNITGAGLKHSFHLSVNLGESVKVSKLSQINKAVFNATYMAESGSPIMVRKEIYFQVDWTGDFEIELAQHIDGFRTNSSDKTLIVETEVIDKLNYSGKSNILPIKETKLVVTVPAYNGTYPQSATVSAKKTVATNGQDGVRKALTFNNQNYQYDSNNHTITITVNNEPDSSGYVPCMRGTDEFIITYIYPQDAYNSYTNTPSPHNAVQITNKIDATMKLYSGNSEKTISNNIDEYLELRDTFGEDQSKKNKIYMYINTVDNSTKVDLSFGWIVTLEIKENANSTNYRLVWDSPIFNKDQGSGIELPSRIDTTSYVGISEISIPQESFQEFLGNSGQITIKTSDNQQIGIITTSSDVNSQGYYTLTIPKEYQKSSDGLILETNKPVNNLTKLLVYFTQTISSDLPYTLQQVQSIKDMTQTVTMYSSTDNGSNWDKDENPPLVLVNQFADSETDADLNIETSSLKAGIQNQTLKLNIPLNNGADYPYTDIWGKSYFDIELPEYIYYAKAENLTLNCAQVNSSLDMSIGDLVLMVKDSKIHILFIINGEQAAYFSQPYRVNLELTVHVDKYAKPGSKDITLHYINTDKYTYKHPSNWVLSNSDLSQYPNYSDLNINSPGGIATAQIEFTTDPTLLCVAELTNYDSTNPNKSINSLDNPNGTDKIVRTGVNNVNMNLTVQNNHTVDVTGVKILGRIPYSGNTSSISNIALNTNINTTMASPITAVGSNSHQYKIYYSTNPNATNDQNLGTNNWTQQAPSNLSTVRSYLIVIEDTLNSGEQLKFNYKFNVPGNLNYNQILFADFGTYYTVNGTQATVQTPKIGLNTDEGPTFEFTKTATLEDGTAVTSDTNVKEGDKIKYKLHVKNTSNVEAKNIVITDNIPDNTVYFNTETNTIDAIKQSVTFNINTLSANASKDFEFTVVVKQISQAEKISNTANLVADGIPSTPSNTLDISSVVTTPNLSLIKSSNIPDGSVVREGNEITYTIVVTNNGTGIAHNVVITDVIPTHTTFISPATGGSYDASSNTLTFNVGNIAAGDSKTYSFKVKVGKIDNNTTIENTAKYSSEDSDNNSGDSNKVTITAKTSDPSLEFKKTSNIPDGQKVKEGDIIEYTLTVKNNGYATAKQLVITDNIPENTIYLNNSNQQEPSTRQITFGPFDLDVGQTATYKFKVVVDRITADTTISNIASISGENSDGANSNTVGIPAERSDSSISFEKTSDIPEGSTVKEGDIITYTLSVRNTGNVVTSDLVITDNIPENTTYINEQGQRDPKTVIEFGPFDLQPNESKSFKFKVVVNRINENTQIVNTASVKGSNVPDTNSNTLGIPAEQSDSSISFEKTSDIPEGSTVKEGDIITYTLTVRNIGNVVISDLVITDNIPENTTYINEQGQREPKTVIEFGPFDLQPNESRSFKFKVAVNRIDGNTQIVNTASVKGSNVPNTNSNTVGIPALPSIDSPIVFEKTSDIPEGTTVKEGDIITYTLTVHNTGYTTVSNLIITDNIPENTTYINEQGQRDPRTVVEFGPFDLQPNETKTFKLKVIVDKIDANTEIANTANIKGDDTPDIPSNTVGIPASPTTPSLEISKTSDIEDGDTVKEGDIITYTISVTNTGTTPAYNVTISDTVPQYTTLVEQNSSGEWERKTQTNISKTKDILNPEETFTFKFSVIVNEIPQDATIQNTAKVNADNSPELPTNTVGVPAEASTPSLRAEKTSSIAEGATIKSGDIITYRITVYNDGDTIAHNIVISDVIPANTIYVEKVGNSYVSNPAKQSVSKTIETLEAGESDYLEFSVMVGELNANTVIQNTAKVTADNSPDINSNTVGISAKPKDDGSTKDPLPYTGAYPLIFIILSGICFIGWFSYRKYKTSRRR